jgi:hypothetical protein
MLDGHFSGLNFPEYDKKSHEAVEEPFKSNPGFV